MGAGCSTFEAALSVVGVGAIAAGGLGVCPLWATLFCLVGSATTGAGAGNSV